jgi:hypothetical protein
VVFQSRKRMVEVAKGGLYKGKEGRCKVTGNLMHVPDTVKAGLATRISANRKVGRQATDHASREHRNNIVHMHRCVVLNVQALASPRRLPHTEPARGAGRQQWRGL